MGVSSGIVEGGGVPVSQKVRIERVSFTGAPVFLGTGRGCAPVWSANPERVARGRGRRAKAGLNRGIQAGRWGRIREVLTDKCTLAGVRLVAVNPAYTSQTCPTCGHVAKENRESQAVFHCRSCGHRDNADVNAARNILTLGLQHLGEHTGQDHGPGRGGALRPAGTQVPAGSPRETSTPCTDVRAA
jgi:predicted RNA-binding Zn-ribbon protein involved in translation (DUF1610 family)